MTPAPKQTNQDAPAVLEKMIEMYRQCLGLSRKVLAMEPPARPDIWANTLKQRREILTRIRSVEQGLETESGHDRIYLVNIPEKDRDLARNRLDELNQVISELLHADEQIKTHLKNEMNSIDKDLERMRKGLFAVRSYAPQRIGRPVYIDRKS